MEGSEGRDGWLREPGGGSGSRCVCTSGVTFLSMFGRYHGTFLVSRYAFDQSGSDVSCFSDSGILLRPTMVDVSK